MKFGVCYYPEHWPESRWLIDVQLMREAGIDIVRIGEFAWSKMEPQEDVYDWEWLDRAIDVLGRAGLQVVLGTPTATPPVWLSRAHPDILRVDADELQRDHGTRRHYCPNSTTYRAYSRRIVRAMAERYGTHPHVIGWQIDNEFGGGKTARCYCPNCVAAFSAWLDARYKSIETLNEAWGAVFWSQSYAGFDEIRPPHAGVNYKNPSQVLDFYRFSAESYVTYQQEQIDILRDLAPNHFITHNFMGLYRDLDQHALAKALDFATWDAYPTGFPERWRNFLYAPDADFSRNDPVYAYDVGEPVMINMAHALTRGLKQQPFWIMEQQCGHINWAGLNPQARRGTVRLWTWQSVAAGADVIVFFAGAAPCLLTNSIIRVCCVMMAQPMSVTRICWPCRQNADCLMLLRLSHIRPKLRSCLTGTIYGHSNCSHIAQVLISCGICSSTTGHSSEWAYLSISSPIAMICRGTKCS